MPVQTKANWARLKVGLLTIAALTIFAIAVFLITGDYNFFEGDSTVYTYLSDSAALTKGAPVSLNGITVGKVRQIALSGLADPQKQVRVDMEIRSGYLLRIPVDSLTSISAANLLGTKFINITRGKAPNHITDRATLPSLNTADFEDVVKQGYAILASLQETVNKVNGIVDVVQSGSGSIGKLLVSEEFYDRLNDVAKQVQIIAAALNDNKGTLGHLLNNDDMYTQVSGSLTRIDNLLAGAQQGQGTAGKFLKDPALYDNVNKTVLDVRKVLADLQAGKGTAGKLLYSDDLHNQISATLTKLDTMVDRMNAGRGTIGQLLVNPQLYDSMNGTTQELHGLLKDFRANPKKFLRIKLSLF